MRELEPAAVADVIERVCATETFADVTAVWDKKPDTEVRFVIDFLTQSCNPLVKSVFNRHILTWRWV